MSVHSAMGGVVDSLMIETVEEVPARVAVGLSVCGGEHRNSQHGKEDSLSTGPEHGIGNEVIERRDGGAGAQRSSPWVGLYTAS